MKPSQLSKFFSPLVRAWLWNWRKYLAPPRVEDGNSVENSMYFTTVGSVQRHEGVSRDKAEILALLSAFVGSLMTVCGHHKSPPRAERAWSAPLGSGRRLTAVLKEKC